MGSLGALYALYCAWRDRRRTRRYLRLRHVVRGLSFRNLQVIGGHSDHHGGHAITFAWDAHPGTAYPHAVTAEMTEDLGG